MTQRGSIRIDRTLGYGWNRLAPLLFESSRRYPEVGLDMDYSDRRVNLIEEGVDLSIRITRRLEPGDVASKLGSSRMLVFASPDYLARHGRPQHPSELVNHAFLGYTLSALGQLQFMIDGQLSSFPVRSRLNASNGDVLTEAAVRGMGITAQPDFIAETALAAGRIEPVLESFPMLELGIYAILPGNRQVPHRVRVLKDFLAERFARAANGDAKLEPGMPAG